MPADANLSEELNATPAEPADSAPDRGYEVGYGKPPKHTRFKLGRSGNPRGRPKRRGGNLADMLDRALDEKITVTENGRRRKITKRKLIAKQVVKRALEGDEKAAQLFLRLMADVACQEELGSPGIILVCRGSDAML